jgi:hypothetical protein
MVDFNDDGFFLSRSFPRLHHDSDKLNQKSRNHKVYGMTLKLLKHTNASACESIYFYFIQFFALLGCRCRRSLFAVVAMGEY